MDERARVSVCVCMWMKGGREGESVLVEDLKMVEISSHGLD